MIIRKLVGIYEISQLVNVTSAAVINWRKRYGDFPAPVAELKSGPIFLEADIREWLIKNGYVVEEKYSFVGGKKMIKKIAIIGRARVGKSRICSRFCKKADIVVSCFTSAGKDCTPVNFRYILKRDLADENSIVRFISPDSTLNGMKAPFDIDSINKFKNTIENDNYYSKNVSNHTNEKKLLDPKRDMIEIIVQASDFAIQLMEPDENEIIVTDTPGVSGDVDGLQNISDASVYIFVMRPENAQEYATSIKKMLPVIAGSKVLFIYRMDEPANDALEYEEIEKGAQEAMKEFEADLAELKTSIINTSIEVLNPSSTVIPMGAFSKNKVNYAENKFNEVLLNALKKVFNSSIYHTEEIEIKAALLSGEYESDAIIEYIKEIANKFVIEVNDNTSTTYIQTFLNEHHDRVKFNDGEATLSLVNLNRTQLLQKLYESFNVLTINNKNTNKIAKILQEEIIKYVYKKLTNAIKNDCGMSQGNHPFETNPPITMWAEEAIIAEDLVKSNALSNSNTYCAVMKNKGFTSKSWSYVSVSQKPYSGQYGYCNRKLDVILKAGLNRLPSSNRKELIYNSYNLALFKLGQYSVYRVVVDTLNLDIDPVEWI